MFISLWYFNLLPAMWSILTGFSTILSILVILPYFINRFRYRPDLYIFVHCDGSPDTIPRRGGNIQIAIHAKNKQRVVVDSVWVIIPYEQKGGIESSGCLPVLLTGDTIPPRTNAPPHLVARQQIIGDSDKHVGLATFWCRVKDASELIVDIAILAHIHQGDLPHLVDMYTPSTREYIFRHTFQVQEVKE